MGGRHGLTVAMPQKHRLLIHYGLSSCCRSERRRAQNQEHDHAQCVPGLGFARTFAQVNGFTPEVCKAALPVWLIHGVAVASGPVRAALKCSNHTGSG
jgi:hypothetical protein